MCAWTRRKEENIELIPADIGTIISPHQAGGYGLARSVDYERARVIRAGLELRVLDAARRRAGLGR